jgi:hypothetical protein
VQAQTTSLLLDSYSGAAAAYSLRKLTSTYTGSAIRVRRSSDNAEQNIGFDGSGNLNTVSLLAFVGSGNGFVTTWYDQSGNGRNANQTSASNQPHIVISGTLQTYIGKPSLFFDGASRFFDCGYLNGGTKPANYSTFALARYTLSSYQVSSIVGSGNNAGEGRTAHSQLLMWNNGKIVGGSGDGTNYRYWYGQTSITLSTKRYLFEGHYKSNVSPYLGQIWLNNIQETVNDWIGSAQQSSGTEFKTSIGRGGEYNGSYFQGDLQEIVIYPIDQSVNRSSIASNINSYYSIYPPTVSDTDAQAFLNAAIITNLTQANAINTLVTELKSAGVWTKMKAIYPFVGGTAESHKWNLKDPRDLDAAFRLTFSGGWTHSSTGILPNGTNAYADTKLIPSQQYSTNSSVSFGVYSRNDKLENSTELSAYSGASQNMGMEPRWSDGKFYGYAWQDGVGITSVTPNSGSLGLLSVTRQSYNILKTFRNNILIGNQAANVPGSFPTNSVRLSMGGVAGYSSREKAFAYIGDGISDNEISLLSTAIQRFQTSLSRHVGVPVGTILTKPVGSPNIVSTDLVFNIDPSNTSSYPGTGTTVYDLSGNNYTGTLQSGCYYDSESLGNFVFDGINDYINLPHSILSGTGDFTVNIWVKNINSTYGTIFGNYPAGNLQIFYGSNSMGFWLNNDTAYMTSANSIKETTTIPRMLTAIRRNGSILEFYLDGVLKKTGSSTATIGSVSNFRMGTNTIGTEVINTSIYTLQAYSRALSTGEITQNFNATKWRFGL